MKLPTHAPCGLLTAILYASGFILTFGHAYSHHEEPTADRLVSPQEIKVVDSLMCAAFWPLYWSTQFHALSK